MRNGYQPKRSATIPSPPTTGSNVVLPHKTLTIKAENKQELKDVCYALRQKLKISQRELAFLIGSTQTEISFIEKGFIPPSSAKISSIYRLAKENSINE